MDERAMICGGSRMADESIQFNIIISDNYVLALKLTHCIYFIFPFVLIASFTNTNQLAAVIRLWPSLEDCTFVRVF